MKELTLKFITEKDLNYFVLFLHKNKKDFKYLITIDKAEGLFLRVIANQDFFDYLKNNTTFNVLVEDLTTKATLLPLFVKSKTILIRVRNSAYNKNSIRNYIKRHKDILEKSKNFEDFVKNMNYNSPKELHKVIFEGYKNKKSVEEIQEEAQKLITLPYINLYSNSSQKNFVLYYKTEKVENVEDYINKTDNYGLVKNSLFFK